MPDVSLFGVTKQAISKLNRSRKNYVQMEYISDVVEAFLKSSSFGNTVMSFRMDVISLVRDEQSNVFMCVTPETAVLARSI
jgi:Flp pilus assembly protein TadG